MNRLGPEARAILEAGRHGDDPTADDRARVRASVMQAVAAGGVGVAAALAGKTAAASITPKAVAGAAAATTTAASFGGAALAAKLLAVVVVASAVGGGAYAWTRHAGLGGDTPHPGAPASSVAPAATQSTVAVEASAAPAPAAPVAETPPDEAAPQASAEPAPPRAAPLRSAPSMAPTVDPLEAEARRLRAAHDAIQAGDPQRALAELDAQGRAYPNGQLGEERAATRVLALCKAGRVSEAKAAAAQIIAEHPRSPLVDRLRTPCAEAK